MNSFVRDWTEGLDSLDLPGESKDEEGVLLGNLGAKIVGTLLAWTQPDGFLTRVQNPDLLKEGVVTLWDLLRKFLRLSSRTIARSSTGTRELKEIQTPWFFTLGNRLMELVGGQKGDRAKALEQLVLLAPRLEKKWNQFVGTNSLGIAVTNPEIQQEPAGALEAPQGMAATPSAPVGPVAPVEPVGLAVPAAPAPAVPMPPAV